MFGVGWLRVGVGGSRKAFEGSKAEVPSSRSSRSSDFGSVWQGNARKVFISMKNRYKNLNHLILAYKMGTKGYVRT